jgi:flavodoxin
VKQVLIVYFSKFGNTKIVAEKIAQTVTEMLGSAVSIRLISSDELVVSDLSDTDLVIMGAPTHNMNLPKSVRPIIEGLPRKSLMGIPFAAFDTSYKMSWWLNYFTAAKRLARKLRKLGGKRLVPPETFHVIEREGPLYRGELERAENWTKSILGAAG